MSHDNHWAVVRHELDKSDNFGAIFDSPWYTDAVYDKSRRPRGAHGQEL